MIENNVKEVSDTVQAAATFVAKYSSAPGYLDARTGELSVAKRDCALAGKIWGKDGWKRQVSWSKSFDWYKTVDDIKIKINDAEENEFDNSPVAPSAFPIQLAETTESSPTRFHFNRSLLLETLKEDLR